MFTLVKSNFVQASSFLFQAICLLICPRSKTFRVDHRAGDVSLLWWLNIIYIFSVKRFIAQHLQITQCCLFCVQLLHTSQNGVAGKKIFIVETVEKRETDRHAGRKTSNGAKSSKGYREKDGYRQCESEKDSSRSAEHQSRPEMKELIRCGNEPDHQVQLQLHGLSLTCLNVTCTHETVHHCDAPWRRAFPSVLSILPFLITDLALTIQKASAQIQHHSLFRFRFMVISCKT